MYLIWSIEHNAWWCANRNGYTRLLSEAGTYSRSDALSIVTNATFRWAAELPNELPVLIKDLPKEAQVLLNRE